MTDKKSEIDLYGNISMSVLQTQAAWINSDNCLKMHTFIKYVIKSGRYRDICKTKLQELNMWIIKGIERDINEDGVREMLDSWENKESKKSKG